MRNIEQRIESLEKRIVALEKGQQTRVLKEFRSETNRPIFLNKSNTNTNYPLVY